MSQRMLISEQNANHVYADFIPSGKVAFTGWPRSDSLIHHVGHNLSTRVALLNGRQTLIDLAHSAPSIIGKSTPPKPIIMTLWINSSIESHL
jgi:hypothetical protein